MEWRASHEALDGVVHIEPQSEPQLLEPQQFEAHPDGLRSTAAQSEPQQSSAHEPETLAKEHETAPSMAKPHSTPAAKAHGTSLSTRGSAGVLNCCRCRWRWMGGVVCRVGA